MKKKGLILTLTLALALATSAAGQTVRGRLTGVITDAQGGLMPNATVTAVNKETGAKFTAQSSGEGTFVIPELPIGVYTVTVSAGGFKQATVADVVVQVATVSSLNVKLEVGLATQEITVNASEAQAAINTANAQIGDVIERERIRELPLDGRNPLELTFLQAGVEENTSGDGELTRFSINGNRTVGNNITVNGLNASDNFIKSPANVIIPVVPVSVESIEEYSVTTSLASAEFGRGSAQINAVSAAGTNNFRSSLFWFHRNTVFNANKFFNNATVDQTTGRSIPREPLIRNQFGGRIGGPIWRNRAFFFFAYEGRREARGIARTRTVYTAEARQGVFRYLQGRPATPANVAQSPELIRSVDLFKLNSNRAQIDPVAARYLSLAPLPNGFLTGDGLNTGSFRYNAPIKPDSDLFNFRGDHRINERHHLETTFNYGDIRFIGDFINDDEQVFPGLPAKDRLTIGRGATLALRSTLAPTLINEARFGAQFSNVTFINNADFADGFRVQFNTVTDPLRNDLTSGRHLRVLQWTDHLTWVAGAHTVKMGGELRNLWVRRYSNAGLIPLITFSAEDNDPGFTRTTHFPGLTSTTDFDRAEAMVNNLAGAVGRVSQRFNAVDRDSGFVPGAQFAREYGQYEFDTYFQDSWKFPPNLTLNLGLRYEHQTVPNELNGMMLTPGGGSRGAYGVSGPEGLFNPGVLKGQRSKLDFTDKLYPADHNDFAPVISFAWDPFKNGKTSLRGGYRISYIREPFNQVDSNLDDNQGLNSTVEALPGGFLRQGLPAAPAPTFRVPLTPTIQENSAIEVRAFDENLRTPYMQEWTLSLQREIFKDISIEARYVGNHGVGLLRGYDVNEVNVLAFDPQTGQSFIDAFRIAQNNLNVFRTARPTATASFKYDPAIAGSRSNPLFDNVLFANLPAEFTNSSYISRLDQGRAGDFADFVSRLRLLGGRRGAPFFAAVDRGQLPVNFFRANPDVANSYLITNGSFSKYNSFQIEFRRRSRGGLSFQFNYAFSKGASDFIGDLNNTASFLTLRDPSRDVLQFTTPHKIAANFIYRLPFGSGRRYLRQAGGLAGKLVGGWQMGGIVRWRSGDPISVISSRGTFNRDARSGKNTVNVRGDLTRSELRDLAGIRTGSNGAIYYLDPNLAPGSASDPSQVIFDNPESGTLGSLGLTPLYGPGFFTTDVNWFKRTQIAESQSLEFRFEIFNLFNNVNFNNPVLDINEANFGRITSTRGTPRVMQFGLRFNF